MLSKLDIVHAVSCVTGESYGSEYAVKTVYNTTGAWIRKKHSNL